MNAITRKVLIFVAIMVVVVAGGLAGRKAYKRASERRLVAEASGYLRKNDFRNAALCLQRALQVNPLSLAAARSMGDMLEQARVADAVNWRARAAQLAPADASLRLAWAETALKFHDSRSAERALEGISEATRSGVAYNKVAGALAWETGHRDKAEHLYEAAIGQEPGNQTLRFNLAIIRLASTNELVTEVGRKELDLMTTNAEFKIRALQNLKTDATAHTNLARALAYSSRIVREPDAALADRMDHLQLLRALKDPGFKVWRSGLEAEASHSPATAFALGQWMMTVEGPTNTFQWLKALPVTIQTNQPVPLLVADCHLFLKDWDGLLATVQKQNWGEGECFRLALESRAENALGEAAISRAAWDKAVRLSSQRLDRLTRLSQLSANWGWSAEHLSVLRKIAADFPDALWAKDRLMAELYNSGNTRELEQFLSANFESNPSNASVKNNFASICLLRKSGLETAYRLAQEAYDSEPGNPYFMSTYAYSLLLQKRADAAEKIASGIKPEYLKIPSIAAYYGAVEAEAGHKEAAREALKRAESAPLLPEEREIVRLAESRL